MFVGAQKATIDDIRSGKHTVAEHTRPQYLKVELIHNMTFHSSLINQATNSSYLR